MLARLGQGPEAHLNPGVCGEEGEEGKGPCAEEESEALPKDMCWGYESGCGKEKRLFVPQCAGPPNLGELLHLFLNLAHILVFILHTKHILFDKSCE